MSKENLLNEYMDLFARGLECYGGEPAHLEKDKSVSPVWLPLHKVPVVLQQPLQKELRSLEESGVITREEQLTD